MVILIKKAMTIQEVEQLKEGDLITAHRSGYHKFVRAEPVTIKREQDITDHFKMFHPIPPNGKSNWEVGDTYSYMIYYTWVFDKRGNPIKNKTEFKCADGFCKKVTSFDIYQQIGILHTEIERLEKIIDLI